ncbi:hypothetical protein K438DRAFT_1972556 [Mycena galopus ATCC 62051]|nr:hypothetical protein K438DRAFT_1972556 [Mycena galopus ATCC 62051]
MPGVLTIANFSTVLCATNLTALPQAGPAAATTLPSDGGPWYLSTGRHLSRDYKHLCDEHEEKELSGGKVIANHPVFVGRNFEDALKFLPYCPHLQPSFKHRRLAGQPFERDPTKLLYYVVDGVHGCTCTTEGCLEQYNEIARTRGSTTKIRIWVGNDFGMVLEHLEVSRFL